MYNKIFSIMKLVFVFAIIGSFCGGCGNRQTSNEDEEIPVEINEIEPKDECVEVSMEEAIEIGFETASKYYDDLELTEVHSYDDDTMPDADAGVDGKRQLWYVNFANDKNNYVSILIKDGKVVNVEHYDENWNNGMINLDDIEITSDEAVDIAQSYGIRGGNPGVPEEWVSGYNFKLEISSLASSPDDKMIFFEVIGISEDGNFAHVDIDATTGEVILAEEKIEYTNEEVEWIPLEKGAM